MSINSSKLETWLSIAGIAGCLTLFSTAFIDSKYIDTRMALAGAGYAVAMGCRAGMPKEDHGHLYKEKKA